MFCFFLLKVEIKDEEPPKTSIVPNIFLKIEGLIIPATNAPKREKTIPEMLKTNVISHTIFFFKTLYTVELIATAIKKQRFIPCAII